MTALDDLAKTMPEVAEYRRYVGSHTGIPDVECELAEVAIYALAEVARANEKATEAAEERAAKIEWERAEIDAFVNWKPQDSHDRYVYGPQQPKGSFKQLREFIDHLAARYDQEQGG